MIAINEELIKRVENGDILVKGDPAEILKSNYEDAWCVVDNFREPEELEVERSGILPGFSSSLNVKEKLPYAEFVNNDWYILENGELRNG